MLELARSAISCAEDNAMQQIPVILQLSSWSDKISSFSDWIIKELKVRYRVPQNISCQWIENNELMILLDGLDELKYEKRKACIKAINHFRYEYGLSGIVVCCRTQEYNTLRTLLNFEGAVSICPLTTNQIADHVASFGEQLKSFGDILQKDSMLQELAKSPLMLDIMISVYCTHDISVGEFCNSKTIDDYRNHLYDVYVERMLKRQKTNTTYTPKQMMQWLVWLSRKMSEVGQIEFFVEDMQPNWLSSDISQQVYRISNIIVIGLLLITTVGFVASACNQAGIDEFWAYLLLIGASTFAIMLMGLFDLDEIKPVENIEIRLSQMNIAEKLPTKTWGSFAIMGIILSFYIGIVDAIVSCVLLGSFAGLNALFNQGITPVALSEEKLSTNQGIKNSFKYSVKITLALILSFTALYSLAAVIVEDGFFSFNDKSLYLIISLITLLSLFVSFLRFGGRAFIRHFILRIILSVQGCIPWRIASFLDEATERVFLRKIGGGYIFIHKTLLEHFSTKQV